MRLGSSTPQRSTSPKNHNGLSSNGQSKLTQNGHSNGKVESNGSGSRNSNGEVARALPAKWHGHDREEVARILIQSLTDLGYQSSARALSHESGFELEGPTVAAFRSAVLDGEWAEAEALLFGTGSYDSGGGVGINDSGGKGIADGWGYQGYTDGLTLAEGANKNEMLFWLRQQKYLEFLEKRDLGPALMVLRQELTPLHQDVARLHHLSSLMMCKPEDLKTQASWDGAAGESRHQLLSELSKSISPTIMIPPARLSTLLTSIKKTWINQCLYHNTSASPSLYTDHTCTSENFPMYAAHDLRDHESEVWYLAFSHDGTKLATAGMDKSVFVYNVGTMGNGQTAFGERGLFGYEHQLNEHEAGVCYVEWSPDDKLLITCSREPDNTARLWDITNGVLLLTLPHYHYPVTSAAFAPNGKSFVIGSQDQHNPLTVYSLDGSIIHKFHNQTLSSQHSPAFPSSNRQTSGGRNSLGGSSSIEKMRIFDLALSPNGHYLVVLLIESILVYNFHTRELLSSRHFEGTKMTSVSISKDSKRMLISMNPGRILMIDIETFISEVFDDSRMSPDRIGREFEGMGLDGDEGVMNIFEGQKQSQFMIRSGFGGASGAHFGEDGEERESFVVSGSEDSKVYIWRTTGHLVKALDTGGRPGCVNAVAWHPTDPAVFASAGDDRRVIIWSTQPGDAGKSSNSHSNGHGR